MASKERLELDKNMAKADEALRRELTITEEKNKKEDKISQQVVLKKQTVELEKSSCCLIPEKRK
jgi:hypothetical protein